MVTFLLTWRLDESSRGRPGQLVGPHARHPGVSGAHSGLETLSPGAVADHRVPEVARARERARTSTSRRSRSAWRRVKDLGSKTVLDAFTCVECGRCQVNCPAWGAGKELNPKTLILQTQHALLAGKRDTKLGEIYAEKVLWQCTTCGACENQCPVGIEHTAAHHRRAARAGVERRRAGVSGRRLQPPRAARKHLGPELRPAPEVRRLGGARNVRSRRSTTCSCGSGAPAPSRPTSRSRCDPSSRSCSCAQRALRRAGEGALHRRSAKRTGNEYMFQELAQREHRGPEGRWPKKIVTSCPHCVKTIGDDYRRLGYEVEIVHSAVFVEEIDAGPRSAPQGRREAVTYHDPCYLGPLWRPRRRAARAADADSAADVKEPVRNRENPYCCGAGGGLLFADKEEEPGSTHQRRPIQAAAGDRRRHGRHGVPVLLDHAQGRTGQRPPAPAPESSSSIS